MFRMNFFSSCVFACLGLAAVLSAQAQIAVNGVTDKATPADTVTFTIVNQAGFTYTAFLNTNPVPVGVAVTVNRPDFYQLYISRTDGLSTTSTNIRFIVRASERGATEWGLPPQTPWPIIQSSPAEFAGAHLRLLVPPNFPAGYEIPVVGWVLDAGDHAVRANGLLAAAGQNSIQLRRGVGSGFLSSNQPPGVLNYAPSVGGVATNKPITIESPVVWTSVSGALNGATTWPDGARMRVTGHLAVPAGSTLTIGAGAVVLLNSGVNITNDGSITINGTVEEPVVFMPNTRTQPWGGFFMRNSSGSLVANGTIFTGSGANPSGGAGHRPEQCLVLVSNSPTVTMTDSAAIYLAGQFGHAYGGGTFTFTRFLMQRCVTGGEYTGALFSANDSAFIECPDDSANFVDGDNDALYFVSVPAGQANGFTNTLIGWTKDDGIDSGGSGYGALNYQSCWFEATFHEGNSLSGYKNTRAWDTVYLDCGQGIEDGYDGPTGRVERCVFAANKVGVRHGDNYDSIGNYNGRMIATNSLFLWNHHDVFGFNWHTGAGNGWTQALGQMSISGNKLTVADTNFPDNAVWSPAADAPQLAAYGAKGRVGLALAVRAGQATFGAFPDGLPVGLSMFCTNEVSVDYTLTGTDGASAGGTLVFPPGRLRHFIPLPGSFTGVLRIALANPVNADLTGTSAIYLQNLQPAGGPATVLSPLGATWKYLDNGTDQGVAWRATNFNDTAWAVGPARLGFGPDPAPLGTTIRRFVTGTSGAQFTNYYFRRAITVTNNPADFATIQFRYQRDDGCIIYLNGNPIITNNMPAVPVNSLTFASTTISGAAATLTFWTNTLPAALLQPGANVIAAEVHQSSSSSSDIAWELEWQGLPTPPSARVNLSLLGPDAVLYWTDAAYGLEEADAVTGPWRAAAPTNSPSASPALGTRFFRLRK